MGTYTYQKRTQAVKSYGAVLFALAIAAIGVAMMTLTSSPIMKGAAFVWLPAALQLIAGVWFGPLRGFLAGGLGAYAAGIIAYGGFGLPDIIINAVAGGFANSLLPAVLFATFRIDPAFGSEPLAVRKAVLRVGGLFLVVLILALAVVPFRMGWRGFLPSLGALFLAPAFLSNLRLNRRDFVLAFLIVIFSCAVSASLGVLGTVLTGQSWPAAIIGSGIGWFLGDTVSALLGLYVLAAFTERARQAGLADPPIRR
jgi:hypothetical protein